jgi:hypothetical protein
MREKLIPALHLGGRTKDDAYTRLHQLNTCLQSKCVRLFLSTVGGLARRMR